MSPMLAWPAHAQEGMTLHVELLPSSPKHVLRDAGLFLFVDSGYATHVLRASLLQYWQPLLV